jgi:hypothetical protein
MLCLRARGDFDGMKAKIEEVSKKALQARILESSR